MRRLLSAFALVCAVASAGTALPASSAPALPPAIQKIMDKLSSGQPTTPAEQNALQKWGSSMMGVAPVATGGSPSAAPSSGETFTIGSGQAGNPCKPAGHAAGFGTVPARDAYVAMAKDAMRTTAPIWRLRTSRISTASSQGRLIRATAETCPPRSSSAASDRLRSQRRLRGREIAG